jgi:hypothetical protein
MAFGAGLTLTSDTVVAVDDDMIGAIDDRCLNE